MSPPEPINAPTGLEAVIPERALDDASPAALRIRELEEALAARDAFVSVVAHELRNPLMPILIQAQLLAAEVDRADGNRIEIARIGPRLKGFSTQVERLVGVLERLLDVSRMASGRVELAYESVDWAELTRGVGQSLERELAIAGSTLTIAGDAAVAGRWDRFRLEQITRNLLSNAVRYGLGRPVDVRVETLGRYGVLTVQDRGAGIAPEDHERIFRRFERAGDMKRTGGFGVGLWLVRTLCEAHGGDVVVDSRLGAGATFRVSLPLQPVVTT